MNCLKSVCSMQQLLSFLMREPGWFFSSSTQILCANILFSEKYLWFHQKLLNNLCLGCELDQNVIDVIFFFILIYKLEWIGMWYLFKMGFQSYQTCAPGCCAYYPGLYCVGSWNTLSQAPGQSVQRRIEWTLFVWFFLCIRCCWPFLCSDAWWVCC